MNHENGPWWLTNECVFFLSVYETLWMKSWKRFLCVFVRGPQMEWCGSVMVSRIWHCVCNMWVHEEQNIKGGVEFPRPVWPAPVRQGGHAEYVKVYHDSLTEVLTPLPHAIRPLGPQSVPNYLNHNHSVSDGCKWENDGKSHRSVQGRYERVTEIQGFNTGWHRTATAVVFVEIHPLACT